MLRRLCSKVTCLRQRSERNFGSGVWKFQLTTEVQARASSTFRGTAWNRAAPTPHSNPQQPKAPTLAYMPSKAESLPANCKRRQWLRTSTSSSAMSGWNCCQVLARESRFSSSAYACELWAGLSTTWRALHRALLHL